MKLERVFFFLLSLALISVGCSNEVTDPTVDVEPDPEPILYSISGTVVDANEDGVPGVLMNFGDFGSATTALNGTWSKSDLEGKVTITPNKEGWAFSPGSLDVEEGADDIKFDAQPISTFLEIIVQWEDLENSDAEKNINLVANQDTGSPTHFGSRLEFPDENAFFAQAITRDEVEEFGLITLDVPPASKTDLYVVAVRENESGEGQRGQRDPVLWIGQITDLEIIEGGSNVVRMIDIDWTVPMWDFVEDEDRQAYIDGKMVGDKSAETMSFEIYVRDPVGDRPSQNIIGLNGTTSSRPYIADEGRWKIRVHCTNNKQGQEHESTCLFWPFVRSDMFNLDRDIRFSIPPMTKEFIVHWK